MFITNEKSNGYDNYKLSSQHLGILGFNAPTWAPPYGLIAFWGPDKRVELVASEIFLVLV